MRLIFSRLIALFALAIVALAPPSYAQDGPPPEVRAAVSATLAMLRSEGDGPIAAYIRDAMAPAEHDARALTERLRTVRAAAQRVQSEGVGVEAADDGVILELEGAGGSARVHVGLTAAGKVTALDLLNQGGGGGEPNHRPHLRAVEDLATMSLDAGVALFEREHFSASYLARTSREDRRAVLERARNAVAQAGAVTISRVNDEFALNLRGGASVDVAMTFDAAPPHRIETFEVREVTAAAPMVLRADNLTQTFDGLAADGFSGTVHVQRDGQVLLHRAYGVANPEFNVPVSIDTVFGIGSTPIDFTITSILLLEQRGLISRDDRIGKYFPNVPRDKRTMTIAQMLTGRSGLVDFVHTEQDWNPDLAWLDREEMERRVLTSRLRFAPGEGQAHSHAAFGLLAAVVERVSGQTYYQFIRQNFLDPAGMTRTGLYGETRGLSVRDFAVGPGPSFVGVPNIPPNWGPTSWLIMGSGGMYSTLDDMLRFYEYVGSGQVLQGQYLERYHRAEVGVGGSDQGFFLLHATNGQGSTAMMLVNMEGRAPEMRQLTEALATFVGAN